MKASNYARVWGNRCQNAKGYLRFLDYTALETGIEAKMPEKDIEMQATKQKYEQDIQAIREETNQRFSQIMSMIILN
jgi:hypothetical protein